MAFVVSSKLEVDAKQAQAELAKTKKALDEVKRSTGDLGTQGREGAQGVQTLGSAADSAARDVLDLSAAEQMAARDAVQLGQNSDAAAGQMDALLDTFDGIAGASESPLLDAAQQIDQITGALGPGGATGAAQALTKSLMGMVSPIGLATVALSTVSAVTFSWLTKTGEAAKSAQERMDELTGSVDTFARANKAALANASDLKNAYGGLADEALRALLSLAQSDQAAAAKLIERERSGLATAFGGFSSPIGDLIGSDAEETLRRLRRELDLTDDGAVKAAAALERLESAQGPAEVARAANAARDALYGAGAAVDGELMRGLAQLAERASAFAREIERSEQATQGLTAAQRAGYKEMAQTRAESDAANQSAQALLVSMQEQAQLQRLIAEDGEHSRRVAELRAQFIAESERAAFEQMLATHDVAESMKDELRQAFEEGQALAQTNMAGGIGAGADEAARLAQNLGISLGLARQIARARAGEATPGDTRAGFEANDPRNPANEGRWTGGYSTSWKPSEPPKTRGGIGRGSGGVGGGRGGGRSGGGGGAASIDRERQAVERLLAREREALEVLRETDPVKKEMIRNRDALKAATDAERAAVEQLIQQRETEKQAIEAAQQSQEFWRESIYDSLEGAILRGEKLTDVLGSVAQALLRAAMMGDGPLGKLFGGKGLLSMVFPALFKMADGGFVTGQGGGREDKVPMLASPGEFMVNAAATRRHRHLLEHINSGSDVRGYADGGLIGQATPAQPRAGVQAGDLGTLRVALSPGLEAKMEGTAERIAVQVVRAYDREVAPRTISAHNADPLRIG